MDLKYNYEEINSELRNNINKNDGKRKYVDAFCFNCEKGFSVNDEGYYIIDEPYCSLECVIEAIIKEINSELKIKNINRENIDLKYLYNSSAKKSLLHLKNHYKLDSAQKRKIIEFSREKNAEYLIKLLEEILCES